MKYGTLTEALQQEIIEPLLPDIRRAFKDVLGKTGNVRDLAIAKLVIEIAGNLAEKERLEAGTMRVLVKKYLEHVAKPGETEEDIFGELIREAAEHPNGNGAGSNKNRHRASEHLGETG